MQSLENYKENARAALLTAARLKRGGNLKTVAVGCFVEETWMPVEILVTGRQFRQMDMTEQLLFILRSVASVPTTEAVLVVYEATISGGSDGLPGIPPMPPELVEHVRSTWDGTSHSLKGLPSEYFADVFIAHIEGYAGRTTWFMRMGTDNDLHEIPEDNTASILTDFWPEEKLPPAVGEA